ncbi:hypothetical protein AWB81_05390 [Caballeronia arationis]|uniref:hypothetical protein n=1 Tax=Caballeronia arationis TaxID=1777142 RepID=UPI00074BB713|nr:hypothetical protein [Caballeronia arationis]SAK96428.1 hypothetical protein AWB81_05390 [Caballeronia arationis]
MSVTRVDVACLRLRAPAAAATRARACAEDALRIAAPDDERLVVVRRLDLGCLRATASAAQWAQRAHTRLSGSIARAVHASSVAAASAEAVWFASDMEARLLLLAQLAVGRRPSAWYWRLAVPDWQDAPAARHYFASLLAQANRSPKLLAELARIVTDIADVPLMRALSPWIGDAPSSAFATREPFAAARPVPVPAEARRRATRMASRARLAEAARDARLPLAALRLFVRLALIADSPELVADAAHLDACADEVIALLREEARPSAERSVALHDLPTGARHDAPHDAPPFPLDIAPARGDKQRRDAQASDAATALSTLDADTPQHAWIAAPDEQPSAAAGVWLLVRPLECIGFGAWLDARPALAAAGFGPALLRHIAWGMRVPPDDPLFAFLPPPIDDLQPGWLTAWRVGLDRWLRRRVRRTLARVVLRRGWLSAHPSGVSVRFRLSQADIALRLRALDVDPGWVGWLGRHITYHYRDEA